MGKFIDLTGKIFTRLTVLERDYSYNQQGKRGTFWKCQCDCGKIVIVNGGNLQSGMTRSCGCLQKERARINGGFKDLTNQRFGKLLVLQLSKEKRRASSCAFWICQCDCGNQTVVSSHDLITGHISSCGCYRLQRLRESCAVDITGQVFGFLTVLGIDDTYKKENDINSRKLYWKCRCKCGSIVSVEGSHLRRGDTQSCGCMISRGEEKISQLLACNNIPFEKQKTFQTCIFPSGAKARFDFFVDNHFLLEYDGIQHFEVFGDWGTSELLKETQLRDNYKNQWCKNNNIPLKRIPYWDLKKLSIETIMDNTYLI